MTMRRWVIFLLLAVAAGASAAGSLPGGLIKLDGKMAPGLRLPDLDGRVTDIAKYRDGWVMVHFWAGWCGPCRKELPSLAAMRAQLGEKGPPLVMVNTAETEDEVFAFLASVAPSLTSLLDRDGAVTDRWQPRGLPATFLVGPGGRLEFVALGDRNWASPEYLGFLGSLKGRPSTTKP